jgi:hypothetical protein
MRKSLLMKDVGRKILKFLRRLLLSRLEGKGVKRFNVFFSCLRSLKDFGLFRNLSLLNPLRNRSLYR